MQRGVCLKSRSSTVLHPTSDCLAKQTTNHHRTIQLMKAEEESEERGWLCSLHSHFVSLASPALSVGQWGNIIFWNNTYICVYIYMYINIDIEREREREKKKNIFFYFGSSLNLELDEILDLGDSSVPTLHRFVACICFSRTWKLPAAPWDNTAASKQQTSLRGSISRQSERWEWLKHIHKTSHKFI